MLRLVKARVKVDMMKVGRGEFLGNRSTVQQKSDRLLREIQRSASVDDISVCLYFLFDNQASDAFLPLGLFLKSDSFAPVLIPSEKTKNARQLIWVVSQKERKIGMWFGMSGIRQMSWMYISNIAKSDQVVVGIQIAVYILSSCFLQFPLHSKG